MCNGGKAWAMAQYSIQFLPFEYSKRDFISESILIMLLYYPPKAKELMTIYDVMYICIHLFIQMLCILIKQFDICMILFI